VLILTVPKRRSVDKTMKRSIIAVLCLLFFYSLCSAKEVFVWWDEKGEMHWSNQQPKDWDKYKDKDAKDFLPVNDEEATRNYNMKSSQIRNEEAKRQQAREAEMAVMRAKARAINAAVSAVNAEIRARNAEIRANEAEMEAGEAKRKARMSQPPPSTPPSTPFKYNPDTNKTMYCPPGANICY